MEIGIDFLIKKFNVEVRGILHVGAHKCEEYTFYKKITEKILWIEAMPSLVEECKRLYKGIDIINAVVSDKDDETVDFFISNNTKCSSIMNFDYHKIIHPEIVMTDKISLKTKTLETLYIENNINYNTYNFLVMDIQGAELMALKGMNNILHHFDGIYIEATENPLYEGGCTLTDLDSFLDDKFTRKYLMLLNGYGNAFYIKKMNFSKYAQSN